MVPVSDAVFANSVGVSGNMDPYRHLDSFFGEEVVSTLEAAFPLFVSLAIFKNVL